MMPAPRGISETKYKRLKHKLARKPGVKNEYALANSILKRKKEKR